MAETSSARAARLLTLLPWLTAHSGVSKAEAAAHFGITVAQLEADLELITCTGPGVYGGELVDISFDDETVTVYDSQGLDRPVRMSLDEVSALTLGLRLLAEFPDVDATAVATAMAKLGDAAIREIAVFTAPPENGPVIAEAMSTERDLAFSYHHPLRDELTERTVTPLRLFTEAGHDYLLARCHTAEAERTFRLDRMQRVATVERRPAAVPNPPGAPSRATALLRCAAGDRHLLEAVAHEIVEQDADALLVRVAYADARWLVQWVRASGGALRISAPVELAAAVRERSEAALAAYAELRNRSAHR